MIRPSLQVETNPGDEIYSFKDCVSKKTGSLPGETCGSKLLSR